MTGASRRKRVQAVLFSAIMVVSMVAVGVGGLAGNAAAEVTDISDVTAENAAVGDEQQTENVTLVGVDKTGSKLGDITVLVEKANVYIESAEVIDSGNFDPSNVSAGDRSSGGLYVTIDENATGSGDITLAVTLDTSNAEPGEAVYNTTSGAGASASGTFQLLADDDDGDQTDDGLLVDPSANDADAYDTIQTAINSAGSGDLITVESGSYDGFVVNKSVQIQATDDATVTSDGVEVGDSPRDGSVVVTADDVIIDGIELDGNNSGTDRGVIVEGATDLRIASSDIHHYRTGISFGSEGTTDSDISIEQNTISNNDAGIGSTEGVQGLEIDGNTFSKNGEGVGLGGGVQFASTSFSIDDLLDVNTFDGSNTYAVGDYTGDLSPAKYTADGALLVQEGDSIQSAIENSGDIDTIEVAAGTYEGPVAISNSGITIKGPYADTPGHDSTRGENEAIIEGQIRFDDAADVTVTGFTVDEPEGGFAGTKHGIELNTAPSVEIENNIVRKNEESGFGIGTNNGLVGNATIAGNYVENGPVAGVAVLSKNSRIEGDSINIDITNNKVDNPATEGIYVFEQTGSEFAVPVDLTIEGNSVQDAGAYDIKLGSSRSESLRGFSTINGIDTNSENASEDTSESILESNVGVNSVEYALNDVSEVFTVETLTVSSGESIQEAVDTAAELDIGTIEVGSGTYNQNVMIDTPNLTIDGQGSAVIDGRIDIPVDEVNVNNITIRNGARRGSEAEGIFIGVQNKQESYADRDGDIALRNVVVEDVHGHGTGKTVEGVHVKYYDGDDEIDGVTFDNLTVRNVTQTAAGADGVKLQAEIDDISITNSTFSDIEGRWAYGVVSTPSSNEMGTPDDVTLRRNTIEDVTATEYSGVGLGIDGKDKNGYADASDVRVIQNDFLDNDIDILNKEPDASPMFAPLNYFGENGPNVTGNVFYDPVLTTSEKNVVADSPRNVSEYGSVLELNSDGSRAIAIGFSARPDEPVGEIFGEMDITGNAFVYDNDAGEYQDIGGDYVPSVGEVVVLTSEGAIDETVTVPIETNVDNEAATPESVSLSNGWNLVATGGTVGFDSNTLDIAGAEVQNDLQLQAQPSQPGLPEASDEVVLAEDEFGPSGEYTGAFEGTWLFVDDEPDSDAQLATGYAEDQSAEEYVFEVLHPNDPQAEYPEVPRAPGYPPELGLLLELIYENPELILEEEARLE